MKVVLVAINAKYVHSNLALYSLARSAGEYQQNIELAEYTINHEMDAIVRDLYLRNPDVICFSCYVWNIEYVKDAAREIHKICPQVDIWFGGPEVSYDGPVILERNPYLTGVMIGEGERTFAELLACYCNDTDVNARYAMFSTVPGLMYRLGDDVVTTECRLLANLDSLPFVYDDMSIFENKIIYYESSRGCPFQCSYCMSSIDKTVRFRSLELVFKELQFFLDKKVPQVKFIDRTFNIQANRTMQILQYLYDHDNGVTNFHFEVAADIITQEEIDILQKLRPGYVQLEIGVQSTNEITIAKIRRKMDFAKVTEVVCKLKKNNNMHIHLDLIAGLPYEDMESFINSFNDVYRLQPHELQLGFLKVLKGSYMHTKAEEYGLVYGDKAPYEVLCTKWIGFNDIIRLKNVEEMLEVYYNSGLFPNTMKYLGKFFGSPFAIYDDLAKYYDRCGYLGMKHTRMTRYNILMEFIRELARENSGIDVMIAEQILVLDLYLREDLKTRPEFACPLEIYKEKTRSIVRQLQSERKGKLFHVEPFAIDVLHLLRTGEVVARDCLICFDYENKHAVSRMAAVEEVE